jgi:hypothetical protein
MKVEEFVEIARGELLSRKAARRLVFIPSSTLWPLFYNLLNLLSLSCICVYCLCYPLSERSTIQLARILSAAVDEMLPSIIHDLTTFRVGFG